MGPYYYLLFVLFLPVLFTGSATGLLAGAFEPGGRSHRPRILGAVGLLVATGLLILAMAAGGGYSVLGAVQALIIASATALVGAAVLMLRPPAARRVAALLLVTVYPMVLVAFALVGSSFST